MKYPIAIEIGDEQYAYGVVFPDVAGCFSAGDTLAEALENAKEALSLHLEGLAEIGKKPPVPSTLEACRKLEEYKEWEWAEVEIELD